MSVQKINRLFCDECGTKMDYEGFKEGIFVESKCKDKLQGTRVGIGVYRCVYCDNVYLIPEGEEPVKEWFSQPSR